MNSIMASGDYLYRKHITTVQLLIEKIQQDIFDQYHDSDKMQEL